MITISQLEKRFNSFHALKGINLEVKKGEVYGFIGHNGAGKSTTMNILAGLSRPTAGKCIVNGKDVTTIKHPSDLSIGYLPEDPRFYPWMTASETLRYLGSSPGHSVSSTRVDEVLGLVGLGESSNRRVGGFSRGMKQRLGIGAALIHDPGLLILDEPSSALDPQGRRDVLQLIHELKKMGKTVFFSTHILSDVERVCDTVGMISDGRMVMQKSMSNIRTDTFLPIYDISLDGNLDESLLVRLKQLEGITQAQAASNIISVTVSDAKTGSKKLLEFFAKQDTHIRSLALRENQLEDIFIQEVNSNENRNS